MKQPGYALTPNPSSEIEWWYFHGMLDASHLLLVCFWRYRSRDGGPDGLTATYSLTAIDGTQRVQASFIDAAFFRQIRAIVRDLVKRDSDSYLEAFLEETADGGVFAPFRHADVAALDVSDKGMRICVGPCAMCCDRAGEKIVIEIHDGSLDVALEIDGTGAGFIMGGGAPFMLAGTRMSGRTQPRLEAQGTVALGGEARPVRGAMWFDHQWGEWSFTRTPRSYFHPEWIYFAALLDDGRSLVIYQHKQPDETPRARQFAYITLQERDGTCRQIGDATITALDTIESLRTNNIYEYGWTVELPEIDARLEFEPFHPDHEIHVFIKQRGILEVGCRLSGTIGSAAVSGWGFVEVFGDTVDINRFFWGQRKTNLAAQLEKFLPRATRAAWLQRICQSDAPLAVDAAALDESIFAPLWSMMDRGGKGWRSAWLTTCYYAFGRDDLGEDVRSALPITELLHTGRLIIDDFQDGSLLRRGRPTTHCEIGADLAINAGCFCYFLPLIIVEELRCVGEAERARIYAVIAIAMRQGHLGQAMDLMWSKGRYDLAAKVADVATTRAQLLEQYRLKSGCQLEAIARIAGVLAGAPAPWVDAVARFSRQFGVMFQIIDDVIGIREGHDKLGKDDGEDVRNGKLNMLLLEALGVLPEVERATWMQRIFEPENGESLAAAHELIEATGAIERCLDCAESIMVGMEGELSHLPRTDARIVMRSVPRWLLRQQRSRARAAAARQPA